MQQKLPFDPTLSQKRAVFPAFSSRKVTSGQMRKIGIHFIIYRIGLDINTGWIRVDIFIGRLATLSRKH